MASGLPPFPLEGLVEGVLEEGGVPEGWRPTGQTRSLYVRLSEPIVRQAVKWQDETGHIIDPYMKREASTATPRFVGALGFLIRVGRCLDLVDVCAKSMTAAAEDLFNASEKPVSGPEFYVKELMVGYWALKDKVEERLVKRWEELLSGYDPEETYVAVFSKMSPERVRNFCTFALAGEGFKRAAGLTDNMEFVERYLEHQLSFFTEFGMYRDPDDPMTYDYTARMNLALLLFSGYKGRHAKVLDELLRRGGLTTLLYMSPSGQAPFGGRSNQYNFNEATIALICEYEANRYKRLGRTDLAGAFKRAARLAVLSTRRWLSLSPFRHIKNGLHPEAMHGCEGYGGYSVYSLLIASQLGFAHLLADETIEEKPAPFEIGGYIVHLPDAFHKVFATSGGYHVEIETAADHRYDATGFGRVHKASVPTEIGLSSPITSKPRYKVIFNPSPRSVAIGSGWRFKEGGEAYWLSDYVPERAELERVEESIGSVRFRVKYYLGSGQPKVSEEYWLTEAGIEFSVEVQSVKVVLLQVPLLETDGLNDAEVHVGKGYFTVSYLGHKYEVRCIEPWAPDTYLEPFKVPNRNGLYNVGCFEASGGALKVKITMQ